MFTYSRSYIISFRKGKRKCIRKGKGDKGAERRGACGGFEAELETYFSSYPPKNIAMDHNVI